VNASPERIASRAKIADLRAKLAAAAPGDDKDAAGMELARARNAHTALIGVEQADVAHWSPPQT
jgi:hypothetical protein